MKRIVARLVLFLSYLIPFLLLSYVIGEVVRSMVGAPRGDITSIIVGSIISICVITAISIIVVVLEWAKENA